MTDFDRLIRIYHFASGLALGTCFGVVMMGLVVLARGC